MISEPFDHVLTGFGVTAMPMRTSLFQTSRKTDSTLKGMFQDDSHTFWPWGVSWSHSPATIGIGPGPIGCAYSRSAGQALLHVPRQQRRWFRTEGMATSSGVIPKKALVRELWAYSTHGSSELHQEGCWNHTVEPPVPGQPARSGYWSVDETQRKA